jgi:hypothetical protein
MTCSPSPSAAGVPRCVTSPSFVSCQVAREPAAEPAAGARSRERGGQPDLRDRRPIHVTTATTAIPMSAAQTKNRRNASTHPAAALIATSASNAAMPMANIRPIYLTYALTEYFGECSEGRAWPQPHAAPAAPHRPGWIAADATGVDRLMHVEQAGPSFRQGSVPARRERG